MYKVYNKRTGKLVQIITASEYLKWSTDGGRNDVPFSDYNCVFIPEGHIQVAELVRDGEY